jgi:glycosyltransferase involved in cell wall biosynthesis
MKIAYVTTYDASDVEQWSGLGYFIARALKQQSIDVVPIGPLKQYSDYGLRLKQRIHQYVTRKAYHVEREPKILTSYAEQVSKQLKEVGADLVFSPGTIPISHLECREPIVFWTDATYAGMTDFYPGSFNQDRHSVRNGNRMEQAVLSRCRLAIYSSEWAAATARDNYHVDSAKLKVVPFGANLEVDRNLEEIESIVSARPTTPCRLLFLAVQWHRKGGDIAVELAKTLNRQGLRTELTIAGLSPDRTDLPDFVLQKGFISKKLPNGQAILQRLLAESHFLVLPSRADCVPVAIAEANSLGVPVVASNVGGIPTVIDTNVNGACLPLIDFVDEAAAFILNAMNDSAMYRQLALSSFGQYERKLNWRVAGRQVKEYLDEI